MSSVLHPVGPEEPRTYWLRRLGVVAALVVLLAVVAWAVWPKSARSAGPASPAPTAGSSAAATPSASAGASTSPNATPSASSSASPSGTGSSASTSAAASSSSSPTPTTQLVTACGAQDVRVTLTGPGSVGADRKVTFELSVINGSAVTCIVDLSTTTFELKIYSGTDRIWSSDDCATWLDAKPTHRLGVEKAYEWTIDWSGQRSNAGCKLTGELKAGTYVATAQLAAGTSKSEPVQVVMLLR
jgi:hypothetical protein